MTLLTVENLQVAFGPDNDPAIAVDGVSFEIKQGETVALVGESGSGKSVTALSIMRLVDYGGGRIVDGRIRFESSHGPKDLTRQSPRDMRAIRGNDIAMIFQEPMTSLNPVFTVGEQIAETLRNHKSLGVAEARAEAAHLLDQVRLPEPEQQLGRYPHELSGGQRQRVMLAIAIACEPRLLIADEPTTALDVTIQAQVLDLMADLQSASGAACLFITHDMAVVAEIADRILVMKGGRIVEEGNTHAIFKSPKHAYTQILLAATPRLGALAGTDGPRRFGASESTPETSVADKAVITVDNLFTRFPVRSGLLRRKTSEIHAVQSASFTIHAGETLALVGESGSGKSTLARSMLRLVEPSAGQVQLDGADVLKMDQASLRRARAKMQMVFQDPYASMNPRRRIYDIIADPARIHGETNEDALRERIVTLVRQVGLGPRHLERFPHEFSGGQRQRLCIARALVLSPALVVADEPVSALDVSIQAQVVDLLIDLQENLGIALLFISHDMAVVERVAHRVAVMQLGRIVEIGPRRAVLETPAHPYTQALIEAVPVADPSERRPRTVARRPQASPIHPMGAPFEPITYKPITPDHLVAEDAA